MLRYIRLLRLAIGGLCFLGLTGTFIGLRTFNLPAYQFFPALLAVHAVVIAAILAVTFVVGRVYCSTLCPLGIFQDIVWWVAKKTTKRARAMTYMPEKVYLRYGVLMITFLSMAAGGALVLNVIEPYSLFGRMASALLLPIYNSVYNQLALWGLTQGWWQWFPDESAWLGLEALLGGAVSFAVMSILSFRWGRLYCHTICPVGTMLGTVSRFSLFQPTFVTDQCIRCRRCERACRSQCIDVTNQSVDTSRCVMCLDCIAVCPKDAMQMKSPLPRITVPAKEQADADPDCLMSRRDMLIRSGVALTTACIAIAKDSLPVEAAMDDAATYGDVMPPGAMSFTNFTQRCTACHRCVDNCPSGVLQPAVISYGGAGLWQPRLDFTKGYCVYTCAGCSHRCPTGAIKALAIQDKQVLQIGKAVYYPTQCLVHTKGYSCGICARHCPTQAIDMVPQADGTIEPHVRHSKCIGCGSCEYHCPVPQKAIAVKTMRVQKPLGTSKGKHVSNKTS